MSKYLNPKHRFANIQMIAIYILVIILAVLFTFISQRVKYEKRIDELNTAHEEEITTLRTELQQDYESRVSELEQYYGYGRVYIRII